MVFVVKDIIVIFRKIKTILILISLKRYSSYPEKSILNLKSSLSLRRHCYSGPRRRNKVEQPWCSQRGDCKTRKDTNYYTHKVKFGPPLTKRSGSAQESPTNAQADPQRQTYPLEIKV